MSELNRRVRRLLSWKDWAQHMRDALARADQVPEAFVMAAIERWEKEGRFRDSQAGELRARLSSGEARDALHHLGVHWALSAPVPIPGIQNVARFAWTATFWAIAQARRLRSRANGAVGQFPNIHSPLVMALSLLPVLGSFAYLAARPFRDKLLLRLFFDQMAWKLPFGLYRRMRLGHWLALAPELAPSKANGKAGSSTAPSEISVLLWVGSIAGTNKRRGPGLQGTAMRRTANHGNETFSQPRPILSHLDRPRSVGWWSCDYRNHSGLSSGTATMD